MAYAAAKNARMLRAKHTAVAAKVRRRGKK